MASNILCQPHLHLFELTPLCDLSEADWHEHVEVLQLLLDQKAVIGWQTNRHGILALDMTEDTLLKIIQVDAVQR